jgi:hypothetical protein
LMNFQPVAIGIEPRPDVAVFMVWLAKIKSPFETNDMKKSHVTCYMGDCKPSQSFGE